MARADVLQAAAGWLAARRKAQMAHDVIYRRGAQFIQLVATVGRTEWEITTAHGVEIYRSRDYLLTAADLKLGGLELPPARNDEILEVIAGVEHRYSVVAPPNEPPWRWSDPYGTTLRIHTKHLAEES